MAFQLPPLVLGKKPEETTVVVAMSGGVDSSCAAALCKQAGYNTIGVTLQLWDYQGAEDPETGQKKGTCCALDDVYDAKLVCKTIGIPHHTLKIEAEFKAAVIDDFVETYLAGATPIPCVRCNERIKFDHMLDAVKDFGADVLVTGHYVRKEYQTNPHGEEVAVLRKGVDADKDQTYYLFTTTEAQLAQIHFPLGHLTKPETRQLAKELGLHVHVKQESFDICFVSGGDYRDVVRKFAPDAEHEGDIVLKDGTKVGRHHGIVDYTVGQRKGLGGGWEKPMYVVEIRPEANEVVIGEKQDLAQHSFTVKDVTWIGDNILGCSGPDGQEVVVKVRAQHDGAAATLSQLADGRVQVAFFAPEFQISPGQAAVFYTKDDVMLGGGWIETPEATLLAKSGVKKVKIT